MAARATSFVAGVVLGLAIGTAVVVSHAGDTQTDIVQAADQAHVDPVDLAGAVATTGMDPWSYLRATGELPPLPPPPPPPIVGAVGRADCIIGEESGGLDIPNRQGSGATGPGQYFPSTWTRHVALYRQATGYTGPLSLHNLGDVRRVMAWVLATVPSARGEWTVGGCR